MEPYPAGELAGPERERLEAQMGECPRCRGEAACFQKVEELLNRASQWRVEPAPDLAGKIMASLQAGGGKKP
jgi:anti-sigma factor RsiW